MKYRVTAFVKKIPFITAMIVADAQTAFCRHNDGVQGFHYFIGITDDAQRQFLSGLHFVFTDVNVLGALGWNTPRFAVNVTILSIVAIAIGFAIVMSVRRMMQNKVDSAESLSRLYSENVVRCELTDEEADLLQSMVRRKNLTQPHIVFQSLKLFEECLDAEVQSLLENREELDEKKCRELFSEIRMKMGFLHLPLEYPLVSTRNISVGQIGSVFSASDNKVLFRKVSVMDNTAFSLVLKYNVDKESIHRLSPGQTVRFAFARQNDGLYGIQAVIVTADRAGVIEIQHTLEMKRNQLRQYVRIETSLPLHFRLLKTQDSEKSEIKLGETMNAKLSDISGGGLSFIFDRSLRLGDVVSLNFNLPGASCAGIAGKIVHLSLCDTKTKTVFKNHVQFLNIEPRKREKIISYIFEKERHVNQWR
jgi:c-di-GMP-binding flagellar brake protein YcgR